MPISPRERASRSSRLWPLLALTIIGAAVYYIYSGAERSIESIQPTAAPAAQPINRTQAQQKQIGSYQSAVKNSNGLAESQRHNAEVEQLMRPSR